MSIARFVLLVGLLRIGAGTAAADEGPSPVRRHRIGIDYGLASAVGVAGLGYQIALLDWFRFESAVGWGPTGTQLSIMPKIALGSGRCAFMAGFGSSLAIAGIQSKGGPAHQPNPWTIPWLTLDLPGIECRAAAPSRFSFQATLGLTMPLVAFHYDFVDVGNTIPAGSIFLQGRVSLGWRF